MLCLNLQYSARLQVAQKNTALNLRLHNIVIDVIAQIGVRLEERDIEAGIHQKLWYQTIDVRIILRLAGEEKPFSPRPDPS
jgi:hypothetical protein